MEQFQFLKAQIVPGVDRARWEFLLNVWLVWRGARPAFLFESATFSDSQLLIAIMREIANKFPTIGFVAEMGTEAYPRYLFYDKSKSSAALVQKVANEPDHDDDLVRLLQFGCLDPQYGNQKITRTLYDLMVSMQEMPEQIQLMAFFCSNNVQAPSETYLRSVATPIKKELQQFFHNVSVEWHIKTYLSMEEVVNTFAQYAAGLPGGASVTTPEGRKAISDRLADGEGFNQLEEIFADLSWQDYLKRVHDFAPAILALLIVKNNGPCEASLDSEDAIQAYEERIRELEREMFTRMPPRP